MGRKGADAAAGDAVSMAAAGEASDDEEEPTEERYTDPWAEEDEPHDPAADASGAGAARWLLHVARAIHTAYSHSGTPPPAAIHISKLPGAVPTISISHNTLRVRYSIHTSAHSLRIPCCPRAFRGRLKLKPRAGIPGRRRHSRWWLPTAMRL